MTQGRQYGVQLFYRDHNCVGDAVGHYVSYSKSVPLTTLPVVMCIKSDMYL